MDSQNHQYAKLANAYARTKNTTPRRKKTSAPIDPTYGHLQPQAIDVEKVVLGALMIDKDAFSVVSELIRPETFYDPRHQRSSRLSRP